MTTCYSNAVTGTASLVVQLLRHGVVVGCNRLHRWSGRWTLLGISGGSTLENAFGEIKLKLIALN